MKTDQRRGNGSWRFARLAGIDISVHWTFSLLLVYVLVATLGQGTGLGRAASVIAFLVGAFTCVVLHELGHTLAARVFGIQTHGITLLPIGGVAKLEQIPRNPFQELVIAVAGPAVNLAIALLLVPIIAAVNGIETLVSAQSLSTASLIGGEYLTQLFAFNLIMIAFNLLPAFPMDGGRILRAVLALRWPYVWSTERAVVIGQLMAGVFAVVGLFGNPWLMLIALFVFFAGPAELEMVRAEQAAGLWRRPAFGPAVRRTTSDAPLVDHASIGGSGRPGATTGGFRRRPTLHSQSDLGAHVRVVLMRNGEGPETARQFVVYGHPIKG